MKYFMCEKASHAYAYKMYIHLVTVEQDNPMPVQFTHKANAQTK